MRPGGDDEQRHADGEYAEAEVFKLAASVVEEPRRDGATRLLEKIAMQEEQAPLRAVLVERGAPPPAGLAASTPGSSSGGQWKTAPG